MGAKTVDTGGSKLPISEFKLDLMVDDPSIVMIAKRGSGKSYVCRAILHHFRRIPVGVIIAPTDRMNCFYGNFFQKSYIHYNYKSEIIERLLHRQELLIEKERLAALKGKKVNPRAFIVMDDCLSKKGTWMKDPPITELLFNGRHYKIMYILTMQYPLGITPELRCNFDYIFLLAEDFVSNMKRIHDHYAGMFPNFESFKVVFKNLTDDFGCMVISNRGARKSFLDKVFWYKAPAMNDDEVKIGCNQFEMFDKKNYNPNWRNKNKVFDIDNFCNKKKGDRGSLKVDRIGRDEDGNILEKERLPQKKSFDFKSRRSSPASNF
jgi:hypothetical protein